jgi:hypothetical protein
VAELTQLLGQIGAATSDAGGDATLDALHAALCATIWSLDAPAIRAALTGYYASLGASVTVPAFEEYLCGCGLTCPTGDGGSTCVNPQTDFDNCGACGTACAVGGSCEAGACSCPAGQTACGGTCTNLQSDPNNCGSCGNACMPGWFCPDGMCAPPCAQAVGSWTAIIPPYGDTDYTVTFTISEQTATMGGPVEITWTSPGSPINPYTGAGVFSVATCSLAESYTVLCASAVDAGDGVQCGDTNSAGQDVCPGGDGLTATFDPPTLSWWDAHGCDANGQNCVYCFQHQASSVTNN